jgi:hypothetical protein
MIVERKPSSRRQSPNFLKVALSWNVRIADTKRLTSVSKLAIALIEDQVEHVENCDAARARRRGSRPCGIIFPTMAENKFHQLHRQLEQALSELKLAKDPERRRFLLREMPIVGRGPSRSRSAGKSPRSQSRTALAEKCFQPARLIAL